MQISKKQHGCEPKDMYRCHPYHFMEICKPPVNEPIGSYQIHHLKALSHNLNSYCIISISNSHGKILWKKHCSTWSQQSNVFKSIVCSLFIFKLWHVMPLLVPMYNSHNQTDSSSTVEKQSATVAPMVYLFRQLRLVHLFFLEIFSNHLLHVRKMVVICGEFEHLSSIWIWNWLG